MTNENDEHRRDEQNDDVTLLLSAAKNGCRKSIGQLFRQHEDYLLLISGCELDAVLRRKFAESDAVQMAFAKASVALEDFRGSNRKEFRAWLRTILINEINQVRRSFKRQSRDAARERQLEGDSDNLGYADQVENTELTPQTSALRAEQIEHVRLAVTQLSEMDQQVIKFRNWERWSFAKIAEHLNKKEEAVKKTWQRAIVKLDQLMSSDFDDIQ